MILPHHEFSARRVIVLAAPNGARRGHAEHPALPVTADELADCAAAVAAAGASVLHLHVRDGAGCHTLDASRYRDAMTRIRARLGRRLVVQVTTEALGRYRPAEQMALVRELRPEAVSLALRELCPDARAEPRAAAFFAWLVRDGIWPQYILYSAAEVGRFDALRRRGLFAESRPFCLFVLGRPADGLAGSPADLEAMLGAADCNAFPWAACCFGRREHDAMLAAVRRGGHVRIGFENNLLLADGTTARDNADLVGRFVTAVRRSPRRPATADEVREFIGACRGEP